MNSNSRIGKPNISRTHARYKSASGKCHRMVSTSSNRKLLDAVAEVLQVLCKSMKACPIGLTPVAQDSVMLLSIQRFGLVDHLAHR